VSPQRANVMLSRARELEIIIGDYDLFFRAAEFSRGASVVPGMLARSADPSFWTDVCQTIADEGVRIDATEVEQLFE
jgi:hypothetical protein